MTSKSDLIKTEKIVLLDREVLEVGVVPEVGIPGMLVHFTGWEKRQAMWVDDEDEWKFLAPPLKKKSKKAPARE